jgi:hypothetical protein
MKRLPDIPQHIFRPDIDTTPGRYSYHLVERRKGRIVRIAWVQCLAGDVCMARACDYFLAHGLVGRLVDGETWHRLQVAQHLRDVGIK